MDIAPPSHTRTHALASRDAFARQRVASSCNRENAPHLYPLSLSSSRGGITAITRAVSFRHCFVRFIFILRPRLCSWNWLLGLVPSSFHQVDHLYTPVLFKYTSSAIKNRPQHLKEAGARFCSSEATCRILTLQFIVFVNLLESPPTWSCDESSAVLSCTIGDRTFVSSRFLHPSPVFQSRSASLFSLAVKNIEFLKE